MKKLFLFTAIFLFLFTACKEEDEDLVELWFEETQCANPWDTLPETANYLTDIRDFLESEQIAVFAVGREKVAEPQACEACLCLTGYIVVIRVQESDMGKASELGFVTFAKNQ